MRLSYSRVLFLLAFAAFAVFSLRPESAVDRGLELAVSPLRALTELAAPLTWLRVGEAHAAQDRMKATADSETALRKSLFADEWRFTLPSEPALRAGRRFVRGEVIGRDEKDLDRVEVQLESSSSKGVEVGMPVIAGDNYVGRVASIDRVHDGRVKIDLVTRRQSFVGARVASGEDPLGARIVVGGVTSASRLARRANLAVHHPERGEIVRGRVRVDETWSKLEPFARLSKDFVLGDLESEPIGGVGVRPAIDYSSGLFHVAIVLPADAARDPERELVDVLESDRWVRARVLSQRDPSPSRCGLVIAAGSSDGVAVGSAVVFGTRLVGKVGAVERWSSKVELLADRGFTVNAVARLTEVDRPAVLGALSSEGRRAEDGALDWTWTSPSELAVADASVDAVLFTGSGDRRVPRGLILGAAWLPSSAREALEIRLREFADGERLNEVWVFAGDSEEHAP